MTIEFETRKHGAVPFWFWNGDQQEAELTRQLELAEAGGFKGLAIHARSGNRTEYMSGRWLELTRHCCEEALRLGLDIWLYDEEGFPSGTVGGRLQGNDPRYQQKLLCYDYRSSSELGEIDHLVGVYDALTYERVDSADLVAEREVLVFWMGFLPKYIDALKGETVERFMDMTHRPYYAALEPYFGKPITHIYTDDLNSYLDRAPTLAYTEGLPETFEERLGYSLLDHLPKLVENLPGSEKVRLDYRGVVMDLFLNAFVAPMHRWCDAHGVQFTGHLSGDEGEITKSAHRFGSAMAFYEHEHIPGIDDFLCSVDSGCYLDQLRNRRNHCPVILFKQASSVANQLKAGACSCEVLTFLGWGASVWGQSAFLNYELALGVNLMTHHDFSYATGRVAKRDCPPSYFFQQPYWPQYGNFHDAMARSTQLLTRGTYAANTLVIHPMSSCWVALDGRGFLNTAEIRTETVQPDPLQLEEGFASISHELLRLHIGFEYGDEWLLSKHGAVRGGKLGMGAMVYDTVIIPEVSNLLESTVALLEAFEAAGGDLIAINTSESCLVDGERPRHPVFGGRLTAKQISAPEGLRDCGLTPSLGLQTAEPHAPVICHTREVDGEREHFVYNVSDRPQTVSWAGTLHAYDPVGNEGLLTATPELVLPPFHAIHLLPEWPADVAVKPVAETLFAVGGARGQRVCEPLAWRITLDQPNLMLVDWCQLADGRAVYYDDQNHGQLVETDCLLVTIEVPDASLVTGLLGEASTLRDMCINGRPLPPATGHHASSQDMLIVPVVGLITEGCNQITFTGPDESVLFEPFYLMGDFGVALVETEAGMRPELAALRLGIGDLVVQGLPFYWGGVHYETEIVAADGVEWLDCGEVDGVVTLSVNGTEVACRYTAPYRFRIADYLEEGTHTLVLTLHNTAQNLYGPHRREQGVALHRCERRGTGNDDYFLARFGISGPIR